MPNRSTVRKRAPKEVNRWRRRRRRRKGRKRRRGARPCRAPAATGPCHSYGAELGDPPPFVL